MKNIFKSLWVVSNGWHYKFNSLPIINVKPNFNIILGYYCMS